MVMRALEPGSTRLWLEKIAEYCRIEINKEVYYLILFGEEPESEEVEIPKGKISGMEAAKKFELNDRRVQEI